MLVEAAAGGVGSLLVQLAHQAGARVVGAARGVEKLALARELGAEVVVDYAEPDWTDQVLAATGGTGPDVVFDGVGGRIGQAALGITAPGGRFSQHGAASGTPTAIDAELVRRRGVRVLGFEQLAEVGANQKRLAERVFAAAAAGRIRPVIGRTFPVERAADAHAAIEARAVLGKTLLLV